MDRKKILLLSVTGLCLSLSSCGGLTLPSSSNSQGEAATYSATKEDEILKVYRLYAENGGTLTYEEWLASIKGEPGKDGTSLKYGNGAPNAETGQDGDSYIDLDSWDYYVRTGGNWIKLGNLKGVQGEKGDKGDNGVSVVSIEKTGSEGLVDTYTITYSDGSTSTFKVTNGEKGGQGIQGVPGQDGHTPVVTIGDNGNWFVDGEDTGVNAQGIQGPKGDKGDDGVSVVSIAKTSESGLADIYTITYSDGHTSTFVVMNGAKGDQGIQGIPGEDGHSPVVTIGDNGNWFVDGKDTGVHAQGVQGPKGDKGEDGNDGVSIVSVEKIGSEGLIDTYRITYSDGTTSTFTVTNGQKGDKGDKGDTSADGKDGSDGKSAYEIYKEAHPEYEGDEQQWLDDLVNGRLGTEEKKTYTVTFDLGYDNLSFTQEVEEGKKATKPETPTRNGYNFVDWADENEDHWVFNGFPITDDITLYAVWSDPIEYTVTFVNNGGTVLDVETGNYGGTVVYHGVTPVAENQDPHYYYTFSGWDKDLVITGDMTITAQYISSYIATTAYYYDYDGETLLATVPLAEGEAPHYDGETPTRERDKANKLQFEFEKWEKIEETGNSIKFVAKYSSCTDGLDVEGNAITYYHGTSTDVVIPSFWGGNKITRITESAFNGCSSVKSVTIPDSVISIGRNAFQGCSSLASIAIPDSVKSIGDSAFNGCSSLKSVVIPDLVTSIEGYTFDGCSSLSMVDIPDGVTLIDWYAFNGCSELKTVAIPDSVTSIGYGAFNGCSSLASITIPDSVTSIGTYAFSGCSSLASIAIPDSVTSIGYGAFNGCSSLAIYVQAEYAPKGWDSSWSGGRQVYYGYLRSETIDGITYALQEIDGEKVASVSSCDKNVENADITSSIGEYPVISIGSYAFNGCSNLKSISIPDSVTSIGTYAFSGCSSLASIAIPDSITLIEGYTFYGCTSLKSCTIPDSVASIGDNAFRYCSSLSSVTIPDSVTSIGDGAFYECSSLVSVTIPDSVTSIGDGAFYECSSLASVTIPDSITLIEGYTFYGCTSLKSCTIPDSVASIGDNAFRYCSSLSSVTIPDSVTSIGDGAFYGCSSLTIYCEATSQPEGWNSNWNSYNRPVVWGIKSFGEENEYSYYIMNINGEDIAYIYAYSGEQSETLTIPSTLGGVRVAGLGDDLFKGCSWLKTLIIPEGVTEIGKECFYGCASLKSVAIPNSVTSIGEYAFSACSSLTIICETVSQPEGWSENWNYSNRPVVWGCKSSGLENGFSYYVTNVNEEDVAYIYAYSGEQSETLTIPSTLGGLRVAGLGSGLFKGCDWLKALIIPEGVTEIGNDCFYQCTSLVSIVIPTGVTKINYGTFWYDSALQYAYYCGTAEEWAKVDRSENIGIEFSRATVYFYSEEEPQEAGNYWHYVDGVPTVW